MSSVTVNSTRIGGGAWFYTTTRERWFWWEKCVRRESQRREAQTPRIPKAYSPAGHSLVSKPSPAFVWNRNTFKNPCVYYPDACWSNNEPHSSSQWQPRSVSVTHATCQPGWVTALLDVIPSWSLGDDVTSTWKLASFVLHRGKFPFVNGC